MFVVFHNRRQNGDPHAVRADLVHNVHQEADGTVRIVVMWGDSQEYNLDPTETFQEVVDALNQALL